LRLAAAGRPATAAVPAPANQAPPWTVHGAAGAPAIVLVHGAIIGGIWGPQVERLRDRYRLVVVDLPGHGRLAAERFSIDRALDVIRAAVDDGGGGRALVVGLSLGGYVATAFAARHPERVRGLVVADASLEPVGLAALGVLAYGWMLRWLPAALVREVNVGLFRRAYGRARAAELAAGHDARAGGRAVITLRGVRFRDRMRAYGGPVLVLNGARDRVMVAGERRYVAGIDNVSVERIAGAAHLSNLDQPEAFTNAVVRFEASLGA
jgi:pimeloyl-ACP methyl ester carboxylesterase